MDDFALATIAEPSMLRPVFLDCDRAILTTVLFLALAVVDFLKGVNVYLIGMMGVGKSTIGRLISNQLRYQFFDTDAVIEQAAHRSVAEIFAEEGEAEFRRIETQVLAELAPYKRLTIATGGGIVLKRENWSYLHHGIVVWLDVPLEELYVRLQADKHRPLLQTPDPLATLQGLMAERRSLYAQADVHVLYQPQMTPQQMADRTIVQIQQALKPQALDGGEASV